MMRTRNAGGGNPPARTTRQQLPYHARPAKSTPFRRILPGRPDRRPPQAPARRPGSCHAAALGLLVSALALQNDADLGPRQRAKVWLNAERWAIEIIEARHTGRSEAA